MGRKFSLDLRLKLGQVKAVSKSNAPIEQPLESPPLAYESLGPPLSAKIEAELRAACAHVAQDYKPSEQIYEELLRDQPNSKPRANGHGDYVAGVVQESAGGALPSEETSSRAQQKAANRMPRSRSLMNAMEEMQLSYSNGSRYKSFATQHTGEGEQQPVKELQRSATEGASIQQRPISPGLSTTTAKAAVRSPHSRSRSIPLPVYYPPSMSKNEDFDQSKTTTGRISSRDTADFTPATDLSEYPWTTGGSTAPTSAALASLQSSKRTSSQALQSGHVESGRVPTVDAEWMQRELEKHKKLQEARAQQEAQEALVASVIAETTSQTRGLGEITIHRGVGVPEQKDTAARPSSRNSRMGSFTQEVRHYFRPDPADLESAEGTRPQSRRSGSFSRHLQDFVRPRSSQLRRESYDRVNRSRAESIESNQTAATSTSVNSNSSRWRSWRPWPGSRRAESPDPGRSESPGPGGFRGRAPTREHFWSSKSNKPAIDLNRELPPLPSLDQWKDEGDDGNGEAQSPSTAATASPIDPSHQYQATARTKSKHIPARSAPLVPLSSPSQNLQHPSRRTPLNSPEIDSHALLASDFDDPAAAAIIHSDRSHGNGNGGRRHRSRSIQADYPPDMAERIRRGDFGPSYSSAGTLGLEMSPSSPLSPSATLSATSPLSPGVAASSTAAAATATNGTAGNRAPASSVSSHMPARSGSWQAFFERPGSAFGMRGGRNSVDMLRNTPISNGGSGSGNVTAPAPSPPIMHGHAATTAPATGLPRTSSSKKRWWKAIKSSKKDPGYFDRVSGSRPDSKAGVMVVESGHGGSPVVMF